MIKSQRSHTDDFFQCEKEKISELRGRIQQLTESEQLAKAELAEARQEWETARISLEGKLRTVQRERLALEEDIQKVRPTLTFFF